MRRRYLQILSPSLFFILSLFPSKEGRRKKEREDGRKEGWTFFSHQQQEPFGSNRLLFSRFGSLWVNIIITTRENLQECRERERERKKRKERKEKERERGSKEEREREIEVGDQRRDMRWT